MTGLGPQGSPDGARQLTQHKEANALLREKINLNCAFPWAPEGHQGGVYPKLGPTRVTRWHTPHQERPFRPQGFAQLPNSKLPALRAQIVRLTGDMGYLPPQLSYLASRGVKG